MVNTSIESITLTPKTKRYHSLKILWKRDEMNFICANLMRDHTNPKFQNIKLRLSVFHKNFKKNDIELFSASKYNIRAFDWCQINLLLPPSKQDFGDTPSFVRLDLFTLKKTIEIPPFWRVFYHKGKRRAVAGRWLLKTNKNKKQKRRKQFPFFLDRCSLNHDILDFIQIWFRTF